MRRDCAHKSFDLNIHVKLQKTSATSKSFEGNKSSRALFPASRGLSRRDKNERKAIRFSNIAQFFITVVASVTKYRGSWVVGRGRGSWVWVNVVGKKEVFQTK